MSEAAAEVATQPAARRKRKQPPRGSPAPPGPPVSLPSAPAIARPRKQIAILGTTPSRLLAPINDLSWPIWTIGPGGKDAHRWDRLYEVHHVWPENFAGYLNDLSQVKPPQQVVTLRPARELIAKWRLVHGDTEETRKVTGDWAANVVYPRDYMREKWHRDLWFGSSINYAIAQAIEEMEGFDGPKDLGLFGIDLESGEEYVSQFISCAHMLDHARMRGINLVMPTGCGLLRDLRPYPERYETNFALCTEKKGQWLGQSLGQLEQQFENVKAELHRIEGRLEILRKVTPLPADDIKKFEEQMMQGNMQLGQLAANVNQLKGEKSATEYYRRQYVFAPNDP